MKERFIIIIIAIIAGLFITTAGFFIYQSTKRNPNSPTPKKIAVSPSTNQSNNALYVKVTSPTDESLTNKRTLQITGTTNPNNLVIVSTNLQDVEGKPTQDGNFAITIDIDAGPNVIITRSIAPNGDSVKDIRMVTYSTEEF